MAFVRLAVAGFLSACVLVMSLLAQPPQSNVDPKTYKIGAGDVLRIAVRDQPNLPAVLTVSAEGKITPRMLAEVQVAGLTPEEVAKKLTEAYSKLIRDPLVEVSIERVADRR